MTAAIEVRERGIPFTAEMVQAILRNEKSQTRRVIKWQPTPPCNCVVVTSDGHALFFQGTTVESPACDIDHKIPKSPYLVGDHLWVKETYTTNAFDGTLYRADYEEWHATKGMGWKGGRFMPKAAARIWLEVTDVRVERIQQISEEDAKAEGVAKNWLGDNCPPEYENEYMNYEGDEEDFPCYSARDSYRTLWNKINGDRPGCRWVDNPMVWAYSFRRIEH